MKVQFDLPMTEALAAPGAKRAYNRTLFTEVAPRYDFVTRALSFGRDRSWKRELVGHLPALNRPFCVDLACGTGDITQLVANRFPEGVTVGLDLTPGMLQLARRRAMHPASSYVEGDMNALPWGDGSVDIITGGYALRNAPDLDRALSEISRIAHAGSVAAFLDFSKPASRLGQRISHVLLKTWGGLWGWALHGQPDVYGYIAESLRRYPDREEMRRRFVRAGWNVVKSRRPCFGLLEILVLERTKGPAA